MMTDFNNRAARGQAYNLAVLTSIADGRHNDKEYVMRQFFSHLEFASILQECSNEQLSKVLSCESVLKKLDEIQREIGGL